MIEFLRENWGSIASVAGLALTVWTLTVAQGAKRAAERAFTVSRRQSLAVELEGAYDRVRQIGGFLRDRKWELTQLRVEEVLGTFTGVSPRWGDQLSEDSRRALVTVSTLLRSLGRLAAESSIRPLTEVEHRQGLRAQLRISELASQVLGEARRTTERSFEEYDL
jgi:hypothetical protein